MRRWRGLRWLVGAGLVLGLAAELVRRNVVLPIDGRIAKLRDWRPSTAVQVHDARGNRIDSFYLERRIWVSIDALPAHVWQAVVAAEDRRYFEHPGVDGWGIARAALVNWRAGEVREGGSTLTQQLVKNLVVGSDRSLERKLSEAVAAWRLEGMLDKRELLELYLNFVYLGSGNHGVEAAAQDYFGKPAAELSPGEAALLAGLIPAPSRYSPREDPAEARARRRQVLAAMVDEGYLSRETAAIEAEAEIAPPRRRARATTVDAAYRTAVRAELRGLLGGELPYELGLRVRTPMDPDVQKLADGAVRDAVADVLTRQGHRGPVGQVDRWDPDAWQAFQELAPGFARDASGALLPPEMGDCFTAAMVEQGKPLVAGGERWRLESGEWWRRVRHIDEDAPHPVLWHLAEPGQLYEVCRTDAFEGSVVLRDRSHVDGAAVVLHNQTGQVVALVGGTEAELGGYNLATQARRQPGSSFKPYVYATALAAGHSQVDEVLDGPIVLSGGRGRVWSPKNYGDDYAGLLPMRSALARSLNTVSVRLALEVGPAAIAHTAAGLGVRAELREDVTLSLGSSEVTVMDQAVGYASLARMGRRAAPVFISRLDDDQGGTLARAGESLTATDGRRTTLPGADGPQAVSSAVAYQTLDMMRQVVEVGTARRARAEGRDRAGKTGTTSDFVDAWFVGTTPDYTVAVWIGATDRKGLGQGETGGRAALPAWRAIVDGLEDLGLLDPDARFEVPSDAVMVPWHGRWIAVDRAHVPQDLLDVPVPGPEPLAPFPGSGLTPAAEPLSLR